MRDNNEQWLKIVLDDFLKGYKSSDKLKEAQITNEWSKIVGPIFAQHTTSITLKGKYLFVRIDAPSVKYELYMARNLLIKSINNFFNKTLIEKIFFQ